MRERRKKGRRTRKSDERRNIKTNIEIQGRRQKKRKRRKYKEGKWRRNEGKIGKD